jgi:L-alanine-DL-glutamate epimerase-like enolase superfamily enzyme
MDESITSYASYVEQRDFCDGINVKMMKVGSLFEAKRILEAAKQDGKMTMMGCMVETSLAISQAFYLSGLADVLDLDSFMYLTKDPFGKITEHRGVLLLKS